MRTSFLSTGRESLANLRQVHARIQKATAEISTGLRVAKPSDSPTDAAVVVRTKAELAAAGKTPEEIQAGIGEAHKYEGDKLKHFMNALEVAAQNETDLMRILVGSLVEGENPPPKATKIEEFVYIPEFKSAPKAISMTKNDPRGGGKKKDGKGGGKGPKESPWGLSPEQKAAKKAGGKPAGTKA